MNLSKSILQASHILHNRFEKMNEIERELRGFLLRYYRPGKRLILAYSGGCDSKALLYALLALRKVLEIDLHLAHVDHKMRTTSTIEALELAHEAHSLGLPFHLETITDICPDESNLEERYRKRRFNFFSHLAKQLDAQAILLAHQKEDRSETILKRLFEGARLYHLNPLISSCERDGVVLWRPLLEVSKKTIKEYLIQKGLNWIEDETNSDPTYLRSRMRTSLIPSIETSFGKRVAGPLQQLAYESEQLNDFLSKKIAPLWEKRVKGLFGESFSFEGDWHPLELHWIFSRWGLKSFEQLVLASQLVLSKAGNKWVGPLFIDRGRAFKFSSRVPKIPFSGLLEPKRIDWASGHLEIQEGESQGTLGWQGAFLGTLIIPVNGECHFGPPIAKKWNDNKVPQPLRTLLPTLYRNGQPDFEWLKSKKGKKIFTLTYHLKQ